jgi:hypothetical protein
VNALGSSTPNSLGPLASSSNRIQLFRPDAPTVVWVVLVGASFLSYWLGADHGIPNATLSAAVVLLIGFIKAWLVGRYYMETRETAIILRTIFDAWVAVSTVATVGSILFL